MIEIKLLSEDEIKDFVRVVSKYDGDVNLIKGSIMIDGKDIEGVFGIDTSQIMEVELISGGYDDQASFEYDMREFEVS